MTAGQLTEDKVTQVLQASKVQQIPPSHKSNMHAPFPVKLRMKPSSKLSEVVSA